MIVVNNNNYLVVLEFAPEFRLFAYVSGPIVDEYYYDVVILGLRLLIRTR